ncbi:hypothetical protein [Saccharothrix obliqua]|uniref:hypothetical protein n=1 Tax=Saccharothrix obliqua TaxID=2861747 RepID=UPI001C5E9DE0|nr:hypothetical protein [Saccharothrix obliqua]MBW4721216.1 hypothetical protein [Saccharothrix obliqua]
MRLTSPGGTPVPGLPSGRPVLVLVGGADGMGDAEVARFTAALRPLTAVLDACDAVVVSGGTDNGVMRAIGRARAAFGASFPLVGVVADGVPAVFEPNHTVIALVPGDQWGDESPWIADLARDVADGRPSVTVLVNGGRIAFDDVEAGLAHGRPLLVVRDTGRTADLIATGAGPRAARVLASPLTVVVGLAGLADEVFRVLHGEEVA